jgi:glycerol-1-phosphate dehydrogenase [NAD(P)+]
MTLSGETNIKSLRMGRGVINGIGKEFGKFLVFTMDIPWKVTKDLLGADPEKVVMVESVEEHWLDEQVSAMPECDTVVGIGGGQAVDAAKYLSWKKNIRLVSIPTILSVDAFVTPAAGIRRNHIVIYVGQTSPDPLVIDFDVIKTAPPELNIAGIGDLLSAHTGTFDWEYAHSRGKSEFPFSPDDVRKAREIVSDIHEFLPDIKANTDKGLQALVEGYMNMNTLCIPAGHARVEEGSEHYLFYELEERLKRPFIHGNIVGLGIYIMSRLQGNEPEKITRAMDLVGLQYQPAGMNIKRNDLKASLLNLRNFVENHKELCYTVINDSNINESWIDEVLEGLKFQSDSKS